MNLYRIRVFTGRALYNYSCIVITYTLVRLPVGILILTFDNSRHPDTIAWAMRYPDRVIYLPFRLLLEALQGVENTPVFTYLVIGYISTMVLLLLGTGIVATFKGVRRFLEILGN